MALSADDIEALQTLLHEEVVTQLESFEAKLDEFRNDTQTNFDGVSSQIESLQQE